MLRSEESLQVAWYYRLTSVGGMLVLYLALWLYTEHGSTPLLFTAILGGILAVASGVVVGMVGALKGTHPLLGVKYLVPVWLLNLFLGVWLYKDGSRLVLLTAVIAGIFLFESCVVIAVVHLLKQPIHPYETVLFPNSGVEDKDASLGSG